MFSHMQELLYQQDIKTNRPLSVRMIFEDNHNWDAFGLANTNKHNIHSAPPDRRIPMHRKAPANPLSVPQGRGGGVERYGHRSPEGKMEAKIDFQDFINPFGLVVLLM